MSEAKPLDHLKKRSDLTRFTFNSVNQGELGRTLKGTIENKTAGYCSDQVLKKKKR